MLRLSVGSAFARKRAILQTNANLVVAFGRLKANRLPARNLELTSKSSQETINLFHPRAKTIKRSMACGFPQIRFSGAFRAASGGFSVACRIFDNFACFSVTTL
jgi:hypothetical protein